MTSAYSDADPDDSDGHGAPCAGCDPDLLDDLKCRAKGIAAQAKYNQDNEKTLDDARTQYDGARSAYSTAWSAASPEVTKLGTQLDKITDQLKCMVNNDEKIRLLDKAFWRVERKLRNCYPNMGCTFDDDCDFDDQVSNCEADDIASVIADIERRIAVAATAFAALIKEPERLAKAVADLKTEVHNADPGTPDPATPATSAPAGAAAATPSTGPQTLTDPRPVDYKRRYAAALVAQDHLDTVWNGFSDVNDYMDCLCRALTCQIKGYAAVSELKRKEAKHQCHQDQTKAACEQLRDHTADQVIAEYLRLKARAKKERQDPDRGDEGRYGEREGERGGSRDSDRYGAEERGRS